VHTLLKQRLWSEIDRTLLAEFRCRPRRRSTVWRLYPIASPSNPFVTVDASDRGAGAFVFRYGRSDGGHPTQTDVASFPAVPRDYPDFVYVEGESLGLPDGRVAIDFEWLTPPARLVADAMTIPSALPVLDQLGVTATDNHHLLSVGILEAMGVGIPQDVFDSVVERFRERLAQIVRFSVVPAVERLSDT
jgi:hypothetical protein